VILWPDTFNDHFHPETAIAATRVLERAGFEVDVPSQPLCCGRPLYDYGMLEMAKQWLRRITAELGSEIERGTPFIVLEPSCAAVFRDEAMQLFPDDENTRRLARQTFLLSEFLNAREFVYPRLDRHVIVHGHCHHKAVLDFDAEERALRAMGVDARVVDSGCCGMAGSFGFERDHYDISMKAGERVLLPEVRRAPKDALIVADGFSCRTQIAQATDRRALHFADLLDLAGREGAAGPAGDYPERRYVPEREGLSARTSILVLALAAGVAAAAYGLARGRRGREGP
jgi:Fe-S oxidoreductase